WKSPNPTMPVAAVQRKASISRPEVSEAASPTITEPSVETALAWLSVRWVPGSAPVLTSPAACVQRKAWKTVPGWPVPTMIEPLSDTEAASLLKSGSGGKSPSPTGAAGGEQRNASELIPDRPEAPSPTTNDPSTEAPRAALLNEPPDRSP